MAASAMKSQGNIGVFRSSWGVAALYVILCSAYEV